MKYTDPKYKPLPQGIQDAMILRAIAMLSAIFCFIMLGVTASMALAAETSVAVVILPLYVSCLFAGFCYAALSINKEVSQNSLVPIPVTPSTNVEPS